MATAFSTTGSFRRVGSHPAIRAASYWAYRYKRTWRGSVATSFLTPVLYLAAMGVGLGRYVNSSGSGSHGGAASLGGMSYLAYIAPGLLAATAMQTAAGEATWPVMGALRWERTYDSQLATPLRVTDIMVGHLLWMVARLTLVCGVFLAVMAGFGVIHSVQALAALPAAVLTGMAFAAPIAAFAATRETEQSFNIIFRFGIVPLFLFSSTFFPISQLPGPMRPIAYATPLWHGVELCRSLSLGSAAAGLTAVHVAYLAVLAAAGVAAGYRTYHRRLLV